MNQPGSLFKGILLVSGTTIGGGMLALPVLTGLTGFMPSLLVYFLCWFFMTCTGLLLFEVSLWMHGDANIVSMATKTLGKAGKISAWILYLFLFYCLSLAYIVGCGGLVVELFKGAIPEWMGSIIFVIVFAPLVYAGAYVVGPVIAWLMLGLAISYCVFVFFGFPHVKPELLKYRNWSYFPAAFPIAFTAFAYQGIIPTLVSYMHRDAVKIRSAIIIGSLIPLMVYIIWQGLILGIVPVHAPSGLYETWKQGENAVHPLKHFLDKPFLYIVGQFFAFFALVTSFLGVTLGLKDFLADGLGIKKDTLGNLWLCLIIFIPPLVFAFTHQGVFLMALDYAGGIGCALLLGLLPILMVWSGRYYLNLKSTQQLPGGKILLTILILFVIFELGCLIFTQL